MSEEEDRRQSLLRIQSRKTSETTQFAKAGYLWKRGSMLKKWLRRWYLVERGALLYTHNPQDLGIEQPERALTGQVCDVKPLKTNLKRKDAVEGCQVEMWGMEVAGDGGEIMTLFAESKKERDEWVTLLRKAAIGKKGVFVTDLYDVDIDHPLGCGAFATVVCGIHKQDKQKYAVKIISRSAFLECESMLGKEISILHMVGFHKNIVTLKEVLHAPQRVYMITEFCDGGEVVDRVTTSQALSERAASRVIRQLCEALVHLHDQGIAHMDLKPENIVYKTRHPESPIKLIDFSLATFFHVPTEPGGTPEFVAPEIVKDPSKISERGVGGEVDMWAVGIILYFLLCGRTPFDDRSVQKILENVIVGKWRWRGKQWPHVSEQAKNLVRLLLHPVPDRRLTARQVLNHPWVNGALNLPDTTFQAAAAPQRAHATATATAPSSRPQSKQAEVSCLPKSKIDQLGIRVDRLQDTAQPSTPPAGALRPKTQAITPGSDLVQKRTAAMAIAADSPLRVQALHGGEAAVTPRAMEILNAISNTRQNQHYVPKHSPKLGPSELHKFSMRHRMRQALLEAAKTPDRLNEVQNSSRFGGGSDDELQPQSLFANSPLRAQHLGNNSSHENSPTWSIPVSSWKDDPKQRRGNGRGGRTVSAAL